jgi:hypothetical protein
MTQPHAFKPSKQHGQCTICGGWPDAPYHSLELFSDADRERQAAFELAEAERMTQELRTPLKDISRAAGIMERESPLFYGSGANPLLF